MAEVCMPVVTCQFCRDDMTMAPKSGRGTPAEASSGGDGAGKHQQKLQVASVAGMGQVSSSKSHWWCWQQGQG